MIQIPPTIRLEMSAIHESLAAAVANGSLLESARTNITALLGGTTSAIAERGNNSTTDFSKPSLSAPAACVDGRSAVS
jgi:hypothetical protein